MIKIHFRLILLLLAIYGVIYLSIGFLNSNFYKYNRTIRAELAAKDRGAVQIGVIYGDNGGSSSFVNAVDLAVNELNNRTNDRGERGLLCRLDGGKTLVTRKIHSHHFPSKTSTGLTITSPLVNQLAWNKRIVAVVSEMGTTMTLRTSLITEFNGIANISVKSALPSLTEQDFHYFVRTIPNYRRIAEYCNTTFPILYFKKTGKKIGRIGIFFGTNAVEEYMQTFLLEREKANQRISLIEKLREGFSRGLLSDRNDLDDLRSLQYLQNSLHLDSMAIENFIAKYLTAEDIKKPILLIDLVKRYNPDESSAQVIYTKAYLPTEEDFRPLIISAENLDVDLIVIASPIIDALPFIRQLRELGVQTPVLLPRVIDVEVLAKPENVKLSNVYVVSTYDPDSQDPRYLAFKENYRQFCQSTNRKASEVDFPALQGYEAIYLLAHVIEKNGSTVPVNICNSFKFSGSSWDGQVFDRYSFDSSGDLLNRKFYTLFHENGKLETIQEQE